MIQVYKNFFTEEDAQKIYNEVMLSQDKWKRYEDSNLDIYGNFFFRVLQETIKSGQTFSDAVNNYKLNGTFIHQSHALLKEKFETLYTKVEYIDQFSRPGFNIGRTDSTSPRVWHYDDEKFYYPYKDVFLDYTKFNDYFDEIFTMTLMLSKGDFTFDYFEETENTYNSPDSSPFCPQHVGLIGDNCSNPNCSLENYKTVNYQTGDLVLVKDRILHRGGKSDYNADQLRITFQGQGVVKDGTCYLYW